MKAVLFVVTLLMSNSVFAKTVQVELTGTVGALEGGAVQLANRSGDPGSSFINIGNSFTLSFTFEEIFSPDISRGTDEGVVGKGEKGPYDNAISAFSGSVHDYNFSGRTGSISLSNTDRSSTGAGRIIGDSFEITFNSTDFTSTDGFAVFDSSNNSITNSTVVGDNALSASLSTVRLGFFLNNTVFDSLDLSKNSVSRAFSDPSLVSFNLDFSGGSKRSGSFFNIDGVVDSATITAVPLPGAAWLFSTGLLGLIRFSRKGSV